MPCQPHCIGPPTFSSAKKLDAKIVLIFSNNPEDDIAFKDYLEAIQS
jgi:hypothetical protein